MSFNIHQFYVNKAIQEFQRNSGFLPRWRLIDAYWHKYHVWTMYKNHDVL